MFEAAEAGRLIDDSSGLRVELQASSEVAFFMRPLEVVRVSSEEVKMPSSASWLVEAELQVEAVEDREEVPAIFNLGSSNMPKSVGVWGKLMNPGSSSADPEVPH